LPLLLPRLLLQPRLGGCVACRAALGGPRPDEISVVLFVLLVAIAASGAALARLLLRGLCRRSRLPVQAARLHAWPTLRAAGSAAMPLRVLPRPLFVLFRVPTCRPCLTRVATADGGNTSTAAASAAVAVAAIVRRDVQASSPCSIMLALLLSVPALLPSQPLRLQ
jgi:hypothetical protein